MNGRCRTCTHFNCRNAFVLNSPAHIEYMYSIAIHLQCNLHKLALKAHMHLRLVQLETSTIKEPGGTKHHDGLNCTMQAWRFAFHVDHRRPHALSCRVSVEPGPTMQCLISWVTHITVPPYTMVGIVRLYELSTSLTVMG
jgi:hypothetical protein